MICNHFPMHAAYLPTSELQSASRANYLLYDSSPPTLLPPHPIADTQQSTPDENLQKPKQKRTRTAFTGFQLIELEREFKRNMYMFRHHRIHVAQRLALRESQVKVWFQNRRMRHKKETKGLQEKKLNSKSLMPHCEPNAHQEIVQRLMSYSQDPSSQHPKIVANHIGKKKTLSSAFQQAQAKLNQPKKQPTLFLPNNAGGSEFSEIISFLEGSSAQQTTYNAPSHTPYPNDLDMVLQSINNDLEVLPPELRQHHTTSMLFPSVNL